MAVMTPFVACKSRHRTEEPRGNIKLGNASSIVSADGGNRYPSPLWVSGISW